MNRLFDWLGAYKAGYRAGSLDRFVGLRLLTASVSFQTDSPYKQEYSRGYNHGVLGLAARP